MDTQKNGAMSGREEAVKTVEKVKRGSRVLFFQRKGLKVLFRYLALRLNRLRKKVWDSLELADKSELEKLRAEVYQLTEDRSSRITGPSSMFISDERRKAERRKAYLTVAYERRTLIRRA